jgi:hypothetical protein
MAGWLGKPSRTEMERVVALLRAQLDEARQSCATLDARNAAQRTEIARLNAEIRVLVALAYPVDPPTSRPYVPLDVRPDPIEVAQAEYQIDREVGTFTVDRRPPFGFGGER